MNKQVIIDCSSLNCAYNSRKVDKFGYGECCCSHISMDSKGRCHDNDQFTEEEYKMFVNEKGRPKIEVRLVDGRDEPFENWLEWQKKHYKEILEKYQ